MKFITNRFRSMTGHVGIAFEAGCTRMVQVREDRSGLQVSGAASIPTAMDAAPQAVMADAIRSALVTGGFTGRTCVVSMPREVVWTQVARLPDMPDSEFGEAVAWEAAERFGVPRTQLQCDWIRTGGVPGERQEVLLVAVDREQLDQRLDAVLAAGLRPMAVDTGFGGAARLFSRRFRRSADAGRTRALLDVGPSGSMLMVLRGSSIVFCKPVSIGGRHLDECIADRLDLDTPSAAELRRARLQDRSALDPSTDGAVADALKPVLAELSRETMLCLRHYSVAIRGERPECLHLSGSEAVEPGLCDLVANLCRLETHMDDDAGTLAALQAGLDRTLPVPAGPASGWVAAAGLSLRGLEAAKATGRRAA